MSLQLGSNTSRQQVSLQEEEVQAVLLKHWVDATFGTERRNFMATTGEQQRHPVDNGHFFAYNTRSTDELLERRAGFEHKHIKLLHFPLMGFWNLGI